MIDLILLSIAISICSVILSDVNTSMQALNEVNMRIKNFRVVTLGYLINDTLLLVVYNVMDETLTLRLFCEDTDIIYNITVGPKDHLTTKLMCSNLYIILPDGTVNKVPVLGD